MAKKTLEQLQEEHSELCARAADAGVELSEDLTVDFDDAATGAKVVAGIKKLLKAAAKPDEGLAEGSEQEQGETDQAQDAPVDDDETEKPTAQAEAQQQESKVKKAKTVKTKKAKKATTAKAPKKAAKAKGAKKTKAAKGAGKKTGPRADTKVSKVIAKLKNGGITRAEVLKMTGWKAVSMQQLAKGAGITLKVSEERPFTYRAAK